jgi:hypothetical protein
LFALCAAALFLGASSVVADDDPCTKSGIIVSNGTMLDLWYKKNNGECSFWMHENIFTIKPEDTVKVVGGINSQGAFVSDKQIRASEYIFTRFSAVDYQNNPTDLPS